MRQYKTGKAKASEEQAKKVLNAMHELGKELLCCPCLLISTVSYFGSVSYTHLTLPTTPYV